MKINFINTPVKTYKFDIPDDGSSRDKNSNPVGWYKDLCGVIFFRSSRGICVCINERFNGPSFYHNGMHEYCTFLGSKYDYAVTEITMGPI